MSIFIRTAGPGAAAHGPSVVRLQPAAALEPATSAAWHFGGPEHIRVPLTDGSAGPRDPQRILLVEDSPLIAEDLALMLEDLGVPETVVAISAAEARAALAAGTFDLVLLDVSLGDARADALLPDLQGIPIVLVTARLAEELPPGLAGLPLVAKPVQPDDLAALLRRYTGIASGQSMR